MRGEHYSYSLRASENIATLLETPILCFLQINQVFLVLGEGRWVYFTYVRHTIAEMAVVFLFMLEFLLWRGYDKAAPSSYRKSLPPYVNIRTV
jgi:hypothetical protein